MAIYTVKKNIQLQPKFWLSEFVCPDGSGEVMFNYLLGVKLQQLRNRVNINNPRNNYGIKIVSGYRNPVYNKSIGGADDSFHMLGEAGDLRCSAISLWDFMLMAEEIGFGGIGIYNEDLHVDVGARHSRWYASYRKNTPSEQKYFDENGFHAWTHTNVTK